MSEWPGVLRFTYWVPAMWSAHLSPKNSGVGKQQMRNVNTCNGTQCEMCYGQDLQAEPGPQKRILLPGGGCGRLKSRASDVHWGGRRCYSRPEGTVCAQLGDVTACDILGDWPVVLRGKEFQLQDAHMNWGPAAVNREGLVEPRRALEGFWRDWIFWYLLRQQEITHGGCQGQGGCTQSPEAQVLHPRLPDPPLLVLPVNSKPVTMSTPVFLWPQKTASFY